MSVQLSREDVSPVQDGFREGTEGCRTSYLRREDVTGTGPRVSEGAKGARGERRVRVGRPR